MIKTYERHFLVADLLLPLFVGAGLVIVVRMSIGDDGARDVVTGNRAAAYAAVAGVSGSLLGFAITLVPLLYGLISLEGLRVIRESPTAVSMFKAMMHSVFALAALTIISLLAIIVDRDSDPHVMAQYAILIASLVAGWKLMTALRLMWKALDIAMTSHRSGLEDETAKS